MDLLIACRGITYIPARLPDARPRNELEKGFRCLEVEVGMQEGRDGSLRLPRFLLCIIVEPYGPSTKKVQPILDGLCKARRIWSSLTSTSVMCDETVSLHPGNPKILSQCIRSIIVQNHLDGLLGYIDQLHLNVKSRYSNPQPCDLLEAGHQAE